MREMVEYIAKSLAREPEKVQVTEIEEDGKYIIRLEVAPDGKGRIIGRQGRVVQAMRILLRVAAIKKGTRAVLEVV